VSKKDKRFMMPTVPPWDLVAEQIPHVVWVTDAEGSLEYLNRRGYDLVGLTPEEMSGWGWLRVVHPHDAAKARDTWEGAIREGTTYQVEYRVRTRSGDCRWMVVQAAPLRGSDGQISGWAGTWTDVDDLRRLQDQLGGTRTRPAASLAVLEALQATTALGIGFVDRDLRIVHMNEVLAGLNGFSSEDVEGRMLAEVSTIWPQVEPVYHKVLETGEAVANVRVQRRTADGQPSHWLHSFCPVRAGTEMTGVVMVGIEVIEHRRDETFRSVVLENDNGGSASRVGDLERHLWRIAQEVEASGVAAGFERVPDPESLPGLSELSARQWEVMRRLFRGERVPTMAEELNVSQSTVRNHLAVIFRKVGVNSQQELLQRLRATSRRRSRQDDHAQ
jgi:PAS domain S-box-containing protein